MEIQNCGVINFCGGCLIEEVEVLPAVSDAKCEKIYRVKNGDMFIATDGGWTKLAEEKNFDFVGQNGISVVADKNDPKNWVVTVDGKDLQGVVKETEAKADKNAKEIEGLAGKLTPSTGMVALSGFDGMLNTSQYGSVTVADFVGNTDKSFNKNTETVVGHLAPVNRPTNEVNTFVPAVYEEDNSKTIVRISIKTTGDIVVNPIDDVLGEYSRIAFNVSWINAPFEG